MANSLEAIESAEEMETPFADPGRPFPAGLLAAVKSIHVIGVAGMGAGPLAIYLAARGHRVTGEDASLSQEMREILQRGGVEIRPGYNPTCDLIMYSSAVPASHPSLSAATAAGKRAVRRGEVLAAAVAGKKLVAVCGSHGKTTSTAMLISALRAVNFPAGYVLGGLFQDDTMPASGGENEWIVAEIDESDGTIEHFSPEISLIVNLDWDHPDHYRRSEDLDAAFARLVARTRGAVVLPADAADSTAHLRTAAAVPVYTFGAAGDFAAERGAPMHGLTPLRLGGKFAMSQAAVRALGNFNASNAAGALAVAQLVGARADGNSLAQYPGVRRRQGVLFAGPALTVLEDYAHHPTEIAALLAAMRENFPAGRRLIAVFQPHRFSRTAQFKLEFGRALTAANRVHLLEVYPAGEAPVLGGSTQDLWKAANSLGEKTLFSLAGGEQNLFAALETEKSAGAVVLFIGAGDIDRVARRWVGTFSPVKVAAAPFATPAADRDRAERFVATLQARVGPATRISRDEILAGKTTLRVGGPALVYVEPATEEDFSLVVQAAAEGALTIYLLGRGSNLVVPDEGVAGVVVSLVGENWNRFDILAGHRVRVGAGLRLKNLCGLATREKLRGFEFLEGIPGNVGGALRMNAGAMGSWMFDVVEEVRIMDTAGKIRDRAKAELHVDYRHCAELKENYALGAVLQAKGGAEATAIQQQIETYRKKRQESQPREPSAGCIFKNPPDDSAGRLIDRAGLKGLRVGAAEVSAVHANFIINRGGATASDVTALVRQVRHRVRESCGITLEPEVLLFGSDWARVL